MIKKIEDEIKKLKDLQFRVEESIKFKEEVIYCLKYLGLTGALLYEASLEDEMGFDFESYGPPPINLQYDRRWIGFPEISEFDTMKNKIIPIYYEFKRGKDGHGM